MATSKRPELAKSEVIAELPVACADECAAVVFLERKRWGDSPCCPRCGSVAVYKMTARDGTRNKRFMWRCKDCGKQYTVRANSVLAESLMPLHKWCRAMWMASTAKNGVSALELKRTLKVNYRTALFVLHRLRHAMADDPSPDPKLSGEVEVDETYVGPRKPRYPNGGKNRAKTVRGTAKQPVVAMVQKGGQVRTRVVPEVSGATLRAAMTDHIERSASITTDEWTGYKGTDKHFSEHKTVKHRSEEYVKADGTTTNTIESYFARVKRSLNGTWHSVSREHLHRYLANVSYLYNTRKMNDGGAHHGSAPAHQREAVDVPRSNANEVSVKAC